MVRIFLSAGHGGFENGVRDPGTVAAGIVEAQEMIKIRDQVVTKLRSQNMTVFAVPDHLSQVETIDWINSRAYAGDIALEIQASGSPNPATRGTSVFFITINSQRRTNAELFLRQLLQAVPQLQNRGAKPDTQTGLGQLIFCRWVVVPSLFLEIGYLTNPEDRSIIVNRRSSVSTGITNGLIAWARGNPTPLPPPPPPPPINYPIININLNGKMYMSQGILVNGNASIPIDLAETLGINIAQKPHIRRISYKNIVYVRAIDLRDYGVSIAWDNPNRSVLLRSVQNLGKGDIDRIIRNGLTSPAQLKAFLVGNAPSVVGNFPNIEQVYREEASIEGVNYDLAFCQMCLETNFLRFGGEIKPTQNNFAGLGAATGNDLAVFPSMRIGVRAHIQHLKAYASTETLIQDVVDPRFRFVQRGIAPLISQLSGRWSADLQYGARVIALIRRLYEQAGLF
ncbi:MAG: hormogonium tapered terminus morphoprotein TftA [Microcoleaceae cyanobacterium]